MKHDWLEEAVKRSGLPPCSSFPRDMARDISMGMPLTLVDLPGLTARQAREWMSSRDRSRVGLSDDDRPRHGFLVSQGGKGLIFFERDDSKEEQRFTLAHEVGHFVLDHLLPRDRAVRALGEKILPVLNGRQAPTPQERLFLMLERIPFGPQVELMDRNQRGKIRRGRVMEVEQRADHLAFELLAPARVVLPQVKHAPKERIEELLLSLFGLPPQEARTYAHLLWARENTRRPFFLNPVPKKQEEPEDE